jgi:hypothetical protein
MFFTPDRECDICYILPLRLQLCFRIIKIVRTMATSRFAEQFQEHAKNRIQMWKKCRYAKCTSKQNCERKTMYAVVARMLSDGQVLDEAFVVPLAALSSITKGAEYQYSEKDVSPHRSILICIIYWTTFITFKFIEILCYTSYTTCITFFIASKKVMQHA